MLLPLVSKTEVLVPQSIATDDRLQSSDEHLGDSEHNYKENQRP